MRNLSKIFLISLIVCISSTAAAENFKLYLSPSGSDSLDGTTRANAILTLARAQEILITRNPSVPIEIHIAPGTYYSQTVEWRYYNGNRITFTAEGFSKIKPIFDGLGNKDVWFEAKEGSVAEGKLMFRYIKVQNYNHGMVLRESGIDLYGMYFYKIGGYYSRVGSCGSTAGLSCGAVRLFSSNGNTIINSHFVGILNDASTASAIHAVYLAYGSSHNRIERNRLANINGDPIKVRDLANYNYIGSNRFINTGLNAYYVDNPQPDECPSFGNEFRDNELGGGYYGPIDVFKRYDRSERTDCPTSSDPWLRTSGNYTPTPEPDLPPECPYWDQYKNRWVTCP